MPLLSQLNNFVKVRVSPLTINGVSQAPPYDYERIHITKFQVKELAVDTVAFYNGERTVLVINGDQQASDYDNKTVAQIITASNTFQDALEETRS